MKEFIFRISRLISVIGIIAIAIITIMFAFTFAAPSPSPFGQLFGVFIMIAVALFVTIFNWIFLGKFTFWVKKE